MAHTDARADDTPMCPDPAQDSAGAAGRTPSPRRRGRKKQRTLITVAVVSALAAGGTAVVWRPWESGPAPQRTVEHTTAEVLKTSLSSGLKLTGKLAYADPIGVTVQGQGTLTWLPDAGDTVKAGGRLYEVDAKPVVLFTGDRPMWRELGPDMTDGPDVKELKRNLVDLGYADGLGLSVDEKFTAGTLTAVKRWQKAMGLPKNGKIPVGRLVFTPHPTVRVQQVVAQLGAATGTGTVLKITGTALEVTLQPGDDQLSQLSPGAQASVQFPDGTTTKGKITQLTPAGSGDDAGSGGDDTGQDKAKLTITLADQKTARTAGPSAVTVTITGKSVDDALVVPVTALTALEGGGYAVTLRHKDNTTELVTVEIGLVANAKAQVTGRIKAGDKVVVPK
ncbi:peptidoglycan-binding protein [Streptomyces globisporus]|uniref:peptidoglycan-binding protein n=1 Tax=Streptomyces globisporus TaxID=1908 RepID=UPI0037A0DED5